MLCGGCGKPMKARFWKSPRHRTFQNSYSLLIALSTCPMVSNNFQWYFIPLDVLLTNSTFLPLHYIRSIWPSIRADVDRFRTVDVNGHPCLLRCAASPIVFGSGSPRPRQLPQFLIFQPCRLVSLWQAPQTPPPSAPTRISFGRPHLAPTHSVTEHFPPRLHLFRQAPACPSPLPPLMFHPSDAGADIFWPASLVPISSPDRHSTNAGSHFVLVASSSTPDSLHYSHILRRSLSSQPTPLHPPPHRHRPALYPEHESITPSISCSGWFPQPVSQSGL